MKTKSLLSSCLLLLSPVLLASGCKNSSNPTTTSGAGSSTLAGNVVSYSADGLRILDSSGVSVTVEGTSFTTTTDHNGNFSIDGIPAGVYNIIFTKPGFDSMIYPVHHLIGEGTDIFNDPYIIQNANDSIVFDQVSVVVTDSIMQSADSNQTLVADLFAHILGTDSGGSTSFGMRLSSDAGSTQFELQRIPSTSGFHLHNILEIHKELNRPLIKIGDTIIFSGTLQFAPNVNRGKYGSQYYHYLTGSPSKTTIFKYIVK